jgi:hypothetical protein
LRLSPFSCPLSVLLLFRNQTLVSTSIIIITMAAITIGLVTKSTFTIHK